MKLWEPTLRPVKLTGLALGVAWAGGLVRGDFGTSYTYSTPSSASVAGSAVRVAGDPEWYKALELVRALRKRGWNLVESEGYAKWTRVEEIVRLVASYVTAVPGAQP